VSEIKDQITELAQLMEEFGLEEARHNGDGWMVEFSRKVPQEGPVLVSAGALAEETAEAPKRASRPKATEGPAATKGTPVKSPMTGIFYNAPSPGSAPFVTEGQFVNAGDVIGLIEAMKVFNEIPSPMSGTVSKVVAESGQLLNLDDPILFIG